MDEKLLGYVRAGIMAVVDVDDEAKIVPDATLDDLGVDSLSVAELLFMFSDRVGEELPAPLCLPKTVRELMDLLRPYEAFL